MKTPERLSAASWTAFELRTDNREACFESLCKTLIRLSCEGAGEYVAYKNQAGIECYLRLKRAVPHVGDAGDCIGWQCKYFKLNEYFYNAMLKSFTKISKLYEPDEELINKWTTDDNVLKQSNPVALEIPEIWEDLHDRNNRS